MTNVDNDDNEQQQMFLDAVCANHIDGVLRLIGQVDPTNNRNHALRAAARRGHTQCVQILLPLSNPAVDNGEALEGAIEAGEMETIRLLLDFTPVTGKHVLKSRGNEHVFDLLYNIMDKKTVLADLQAMAPTNREDKWFLEAHDKILSGANEDQRAVLAEAVDGGGKGSGRRKM